MSTITGALLRVHKALLILGKLEGMHILQKTLSSKRSGYSGIALSSFILPPTFLKISKK